MASANCDPTPTLEHMTVVEAQSQPTGGLKSWTTSRPSVSKGCMRKGIPNIARVTTSNMMRQTVDFWCTSACWWGRSEQRSLHCLQFATTCDWPAFDAQTTQHCCNLMGIDRYPSDAQMALVYRAACPDSLYPCVKMKWAYKSGSLHEIRTLLELEVSKYMADKHNLPTVSCAKVSASTPNSSLLTHPVTYYHDPKNPLPYYLSSTSKYICKVFTKETCCNDCHQVGHSYKMCPNRHSSACSFVRLVESHEVLIQELTSQLAEHHNLETHLDTEHDLYALFHPPLVIQVSAAADGRTSTAPPHPLHFLLDMGAGTSFFDPSVVAKLGWKVRKNAVERTVRLAGGKPGPVLSWR
ncbi:hypothetical protein C358_03115 [Cryptococcus neoformans MW-RSA852]|nr:hypothetical protein C358_03115 [Cryptococcus neoformans var. grubii MW-RSA852]